MFCSDSWLGRQQKKSARRGCICWIFWICFLAFIAAVVAVVIWLIQSGVLSGVKIGDSDSTPNQPANPNGNVSGAGNMGSASSGTGG